MSSRRRASAVAALLPLPRARARVALAVPLAFAALAGCVSIAGVGGYDVDPCFDGCGDGSVAPDGTTGDVTQPPLDGSVDTSTLDAFDAPPPPSPGLSSVSVVGTGVAVGKTTTVTLTAKDLAGAAVPRTGSKVTFTSSGGTSIVSFGPVTDAGGGVYRATVTGVTEGTKLLVSAILDGAPLTTPGASLRVANPVGAGLTFSLDAANADRAGNFGGKGCAASGLATWTDLGAGSFAGALTGFVDPCVATSGWVGTGAPDNPFRVAFDGVDDHVNFGAVNALPKQTVLAWIRKTGPGSPARTGGMGGILNIVPILSKGTAEAETDLVDINYFFGITETGELASDYESSTGTPSGVNAPLLGATVLASNRWYMVGGTVDATPGTAKRGLWIDGAQDASSVPTNVPSGSANALLIVGGARLTNAGATCVAAPGSNGCGRFQGDIAAVLTYDRALTQAEIEKNCHSFSSRFGMTTCPN